MKDLSVTILPNGDKLSLVVAGPTFPEVGERFERPLLDLPLQQLDELRRGAPKVPVVAEVSDTLSEWLLSVDLKNRLSGVLDNPAHQPLRLVFGVDESLPLLAEMPLELLRLESGAEYLALDPRVSAIVHLLAKVGQASPALVAPGNRLRVLLVRSNPGDLGGKVPPAGPLREAIAARAAGLGPERVRIDVISSEPGIDKPATWETVREELRKGYDIMVYLGHGDLRSVIPDEPPLGVLYFETMNGETDQAKETVKSTQIKHVLTERKVPVVLVVGCLTAVDLPAEVLERLDRTAPDRARGSQGVAQQLVNSASGVQVAIGMRYRMEPKAAAKFLQAFFRSLLEDAPGNIDAAVRAGRGELFADNPHPPSWSAPVVFRAPGTEPFFAFLAQAFVAKPDAADERDQQARGVIWEALIKQSLSARIPDSLSVAYEILTMTENLMRERALARGPLLMPGRTETAPGATVTVPIALHGALNVQALEGSLVIGHEAARMTAVEATPPLTAAGYRVVSDLSGGNRVFFRIEKKPADGPHPLPEGEILTATVAVGEAFPVVHSFCVEDLTSEPPKLVQTITNAVVVPAP